VFSSGAGIMHWGRREVVYARGLSAAEVALAAQFFLDQGLPFMIHRPIPENHCFLYHAGREPHPDFERRRRIYEPYATELTAVPAAVGTACQLLAIIDGDAARFETLRRGLNGLKVIRTTSPLDGRSIWVEVFAPDVSKGAAAQWLATHHGIARAHTLALGNDYNDLDLLEWAGNAFVVDTAPDELRRQFAALPANGAGVLTAALASLPSGSLLRQGP